MQIAEVVEKPEAEFEVDLDCTEVPIDRVSCCVACKTVNLCVLANLILKF